MTSSSRWRATRYPARETRGVFPRAGFAFIAPGITIWSRKEDRGAQDPARGRAFGPAGGYRQANGRRTGGLELATGRRVSWRVAHLVLRLHRSRDGRGARDLFDVRGAA